MSTPCAGGCIINPNELRRTDCACTKIYFLLCVHFPISIILYDKALKLIHKFLIPNTIFFVIFKIYNVCDFVQALVGRGACAMLCLFAHPYVFVLVKIYSVWSHVGNR